MHDDLHDLLGAYALDAVDDDERRWVESRLTTDGDARAELARLLGAASMLAFVKDDPTRPEAGGA